MSWHNNPNAYTGYCTTQEGVEAIKWRNLGDQRNLPQSDAQKTDLGTDHIGTPKNPNYLPNEAIRIYSIEPTSETAQLYNYPNGGKPQPRAAEDEIRYLNESLTLDGQEPSQLRILELPPVGEAGRSTQTSHHCTQVLLHNSTVLLYVSRA